MKNILITGGCGYVGVQLVARLLDNNYKVIVIDTCWFGNNLKKNKNLIIIKKDIRDIEEFIGFGVKIVLRSKNSSIVPRVSDLRIVALATEDYK